MMFLSYRPFLLELAALAVTCGLVGCSSKHATTSVRREYVKIHLPKGGTTAQILTACKAAGVEPGAAMGSGPIERYQTAFPLSDGRGLLIVSDSSTGMARILSAEIIEPKAPKTAIESAER